MKLVATINDKLPVNKKPKNTIQNIQELKPESTPSPNHESFEQKSEHSQSIVISDGDHVDMGSNDFSSMLYSISVPVAEIEQDGKQQDEEYPAAQVVVKGKHLSKYVVNKGSIGQDGSPIKMVK